MRHHLRRRGIGAVIPTRSDQPQVRRFDQAAYRERNVIERTVNRLKQFRTLPTRYDKLAVSSHALVTLACIRLWL